MVGECFVGCWRSTVRSAGGIGSVNVDMSNDYAGENPACWMFKGFCVMLIGVGWVGLCGRFIGV